MDRQALAESRFDAGRLAYVVVIAGLVISLDVAFLDLVGIQSTEGVVVQFLVVTVGAYLGLTMVDLAWNDDADEG